MPARFGIALLVSLTFAAGSISAQPAARTVEPRTVEQRLDRIRELNGALLGLEAGKAATERVRSVANADSEAGAILRERASEMRALMQADPARALEIAFPEDLTSRL